MDNPDIKLNVVVFPDPFDPSKPTICPDETENEMSLTIGFCLID
tara:strand:- start:1795 stop:1926 length:132 start_codon:yes stop_codon:yes gene_type:complete